MSKLISVAFPDIGRKERRAVDKVLKSGSLAQGKEVTSFEQEFSQVVASRKCVAVNSGTSALHLALLTLGIKPGDEVIVPSFTFAATANIVALTGATPVFVDIDLQTFCIDPLSIEMAVTLKTRAIVPVHLYGHPANMEQILKIAKRHGLLVLEDAAQAHGAAIHDQPVGTFGDAAAFSFYPTKNMTSGEGGMIVSEDDEVIRTSKLLRSQGMEKRYQNEIVGYNLRMTDIHAAIGRVQLKKLEVYNMRRRENARYLNENLKGVIVPSSRPGYRHVYHQYTIRVIGHDRDRFAQELEKLGVGSGVYYPTPVHQLPSFARTDYLPNTDKASRQVLSLPVHPRLSQKDIQNIVIAVNKVANAGA